MRILFTGGGTAGHILPNIAVFEELKARQKTSNKQAGHHGHRSGSFDFLYMGSKDGPEQRIAQQYGIPFFAITTDKMRRYFSWKNFVFPFRVMRGFVEAYRILRRVRPDMVFSKGGYVSVPVVFAAWMLKISVILHESDVSPGMANRVCAKFAKLICVSWSETQRYFSHGSRVLLTGIPLRQEIFQGKREKGLSLCGFDGVKPVLLVMGGSLGSEFLNGLVQKILPKLLKVFDVVHIMGKDFVGSEGISGYKNFEYLDSDLAHIYAISDIVLSRAGTGALAEIAALKKPSVLIPLPKTSSRGDQILNAKKMEEMGGAIMVAQEHASAAKIEKILLDLAKHEKKRASMGESAYEFGGRCVRAADVIADLIVV